uniref:BICC1 first type I KH domain-containing protein n=1 Tax=Romanomermis culicivorax TaxID=13658 RepID=A0A915HY81_ROMCU
MNYNGIDCGEMLLNGYAFKNLDRCQNGSNNIVNEELAFRQALFDYSRKIYSSNSSLPSLFDKQTANVQYAGQSENFPFRRTSIDSGHLCQKVNNARRTHLPDFYCNDKPTLCRKYSTCLSNDNLDGIDDRLHHHFSTTTTTTTKIDNVVEKNLHNFYTNFAKNNIRRLTTGLLPPSTAAAAVAESSASSTSSASTTMINNGGGTTETKEATSTEYNFFDERVQVDRKRLEQLITGNYPSNRDGSSFYCYAKNDDKSAYSSLAEKFFTQIMTSTNTQITWPSRLKVGAKTKKGKQAE